MNKPFSYQTKLICYIGAIMATDLEKLIKQADNLIKQERYAEAWKLLLPHKDDENARKRLKWLKAKQEQVKLEGEIAVGPVLIKKESWFSRLGWRWKLGVGILGLCGGCICFTMFGQAVGFIPDATELAATKVAQVEITSQFMTVNAPSPTNTPSETVTHTDSPTFTPSATSSPEPSVTASPSETATPTPSATFTMSPSPTITNTPASDPYNIRFENEQLSFTIQSFVFLHTMPGGLDGYDFVNGAGLVILGTIANTGTRRGCLYGNEMQLILDNQPYTADDIVMSLFQTELVPYRDYLGIYGGHCVDAGEQALTFVAFDIPLAAHNVGFRYIEDEKPLNINWDALVFADEELSLELLYAASTVEGTTAALRLTDSVFATQTATQWTATPTRTPAPPTATVDTTAEDERDIINMIRGATDIDVVSVEIADGRANGGERVAIITYRSTAITDADLGGEWGSIFGAVYNAVILDSIDIDAVSIVIGNQNGNAIGIVATSMDDLEAVMNNRITFEEFYRRLSITDL